MQSTESRYETLQGADSSSFDVPRAFLADEMTLPELWDHHLLQSAHHPLFVFEEHPGSAVKRTVTWGEAVRVLHRAGRIVLDAASASGIALPTNGENPPVIGLIAVADSISAWATITGVIRAGFTVFVISPRNSALAVAHLLQVSNVQMVVASEDKPTRDLLADALKLLDGAPIPVANLPKYNDLCVQDDEHFAMLPPLGNTTMDTPAIISHSSGSTSFPKPRTLTHRTLVQWSKIPYYGEIDLCGKLLAAHSLPLFHVIGFMTTIIWASSTGITAAVFTPTEPPTLPNPDNVLESTVRSQADILFCVPSFLEAWSKDADSWPKLKAIDQIWFGGGPLPKHVGDLLVDNGVNVRVMYGATEFGVVTAPRKGISGKDWEFIKVAGYANVKFDQQAGSEEFYELIVLDSTTLRPCVFNTEVDGKPAYATNDLFIRHLSDKSLWKVAGRADDQIMHSTGEKTNPGPMEQIIIQHPAVKHAVMFGRAQFQAGILIEPIESKSIDPSDLQKLATYRNEIWTAVEKANAFAPSHSRIFKEMIVVASPSKPFQLTPKRTLKRSAIVKDYEAEIAAAYKAVEESSLQDVSPPSSWEFINSLAFIREVVTRVVGDAVKDSDDLFQVGADSLQATSIRNAILHAFRQTNADTSNIGTNLVYTHPSITTLAHFVSEAASGDADLDISSPEVHVQKMEKVLKSVTHDFPTHSGTQSLPEREAILITGTTGSLGSLMLAKLLSLPSVARVYALNRPGKKSVKDRHAAMFDAQEIDRSILDSPKLVLLEGETDLPNFGLPEDIFRDLNKNITSIIHNAWKVDFNLSLSSFEPLIRGVRNLIDLALSSPFREPPTIVFTSSISDLQNRQESGPVPEALIPNILTAVGSGYGESKWVSSRLLDIAREQTALKPVIVRVGQLSGNSVSGNWNPWEWFPSIVRSGKTVNCLPEVPGVVSWLPVDVAASAIVDVRSAGALAPFINLVHPHPVPWSDLIEPIASALQVPIVPYADWLSCLQKLQRESGGALEAVKEVPALKLLDFYQHAGEQLETANDSGEERELIIGSRLEVENTVKASQTLGDPNLKSLGGNDAKKWLRYWKGVGTL